MAFSADGRRLVGKDGKIYTATFGAEVTGDGSTALTAGLYLVTAVGGTTDWPTTSGATGATAITAGKLIRIRTGSTITPTTTDKYKPITLTQRCDITSFSMEFSADEIDVTTGCDDLKVYEVGQADMSGSMSGITSIGVTTGPDGFLNQFIDLAAQNGDTSYDVYEAGSEVLYGWFVINSNTSKGDEIGIFAPINVFSSSVGGDLGSAQSFDASFRFAAVSGISNCMYRFAL